MIDKRAKKRQCEVSQNLSFSGDMLCAGPMTNVVGKRLVENVCVVLESFKDVSQHLIALT